MNTTLKEIIQSCNYLQNECNHTISGNVSHKIRNIANGIEYIKFKCQELLDDDNAEIDIFEKLAKNTKPN